MDEQQSKKTDQELVVLTLYNKENFLFIIQRYEDKLLRYIKRISNVGHEEAEDILQEVFLKVYQNLNGFDSNLKFSSWIYRITHNEVISQFRKKKAQPEKKDFEPEMYENIASDLNIEHQIDQKILKEAVEKALAKMEPKYAEILILKYLEEKSYEEISDILQKPMGTVATLLNRAKKHMQKHFL
ncbi:MAG: RNA polymerase subunit sigma [Candidatus Magasanikbacteria bacterium CG11_big_fil_rev_8_21_14_0_20_39_34]|uniref:RNA polymerase sigma factor n=1 Tax=Candidatus Magasanikbacteria bacterium CG11_big_fil_rev_8_21_14_0_20_39_34 TaxID=1974653 RepID=A0A2H0N403_9BACT|nr:MAG: RNA polymerase subunit sigma [Candidatus Magasanikbacteria bacterium CG11_big_fil_rev_8_21_14_0_20_39_34]